MIDLGTRVRVVGYGMGGVPHDLESIYVGRLGTVVDITRLGVYEVALDEDPEPYLRDTLPCYESEIEVIDG